MKDIDIARRRILQAACCASLASVLPFKLAFANAPTDKRLLVVILRGAMDGMHAVVPYGDRDYADARGAIAMPQSDEALARLDSQFALHRALEPLPDLFQKKELLIVHAVATPYRERSHFDAQDLLENGGSTPRALGTGWLNRAVAALHDPREALALGPTVPLVLRGQASVTSWAPSVLPGVDEDFLGRVMHMYEKDVLLSKALAASQVLDNTGSGGNSGGGGPKPFVAMMKKAAGFLSSDAGPRIGSIDLTGWDTHAGQGKETGRMATTMRTLAEGLSAFRDGMGPVWRQTAVLAITEFGRTVKGNGSGGTDHGTASAAFLLGGSVNGGRVAGDWPGLAQLEGGRDLVPANDLRTLLKGTLAQHLAIHEDVLSASVFPGSVAVRPLPGVIAA